MFAVIKLKSIVIGILLFCIVCSIVMYLGTFRATPVSAEGGQPVLIIMYHSLLQNSKSAGKFVISPEQFESDIKYLSDNGFSFVTIRDLIDYVSDESASLPDKPVVITFDDGHYNNLLYAYPVMEKYSAPFVISVVGKYTDIAETGENSNPNYSYLTLSQIGDLHNSGLVEIQNHSYDLHKITKQRSGVKKKKGESLTEYETLLKNDVMKLQNLLNDTLGIRPTAFTYPYGAKCSESEKLLREIGFQATLSCAEGVNYIYKNDKESLYELKRYNRPSGKSSSSFFKRKIDKMEVRTP